MKEAVIFSIEEFAVHDGPGIRTTIFFKGCPLHCAWCHNPEGISPEPQYMLKKGVKTICGYRINTEELSKLILKNKDIYRLNNGGVTLTGGEPLLQADFLMELLPELQDVHIAVETSGHVRPATFKKILPLLDLVLFDVKHTDPLLHKRYTGVDNRIIGENLNCLISSGKAFILRIPLIPGVNDTQENMLAVLELVKEAKSLIRIELLRYHTMAGAKYAMIGQEYTPPFNPDIPPRIYNVFEEHNIKTVIL